VSTPSPRSPAARSASIRGPDARVSRPMTTRGGCSTRATAWPRATTSGLVRSRSASPRTPSVPKRNTRRPGALPLRVLRSLARLLEAVLAPLLLPRVPPQESRLLEHAARLGIESNQGPRDAEPDRSGLTTDATAAE